MTPAAAIVAAVRIVGLLSSPACKAVGVCRSATKAPQGNATPGGQTAHERTRHWVAKHANVADHPCDSAT